MKNVLAIAGFVFLVGCGGKSGADKVIADFEGFKDRLCKCSDKACGEGVMKDVTAFMERTEKEMKGTKPTKEQDEKIDKIDDEMQACAKKLGVEGL